MCRPIYSGSALITINWTIVTTYYTLSSVKKKSGFALDALTCFIFTARTALYTSQACLSFQVSLRHAGNTVKGIGYILFTFLAELIH